MYDVVDGPFLKEDVTVTADGDITKAGTYTITVSVTDQNELNAEDSYTLIVKRRITAYTLLSMNI